MSTIGELLVKLGLDPATYTKGLSTAESKTKTSMGNAGKSFDDAGTHVSKFGSIMSGMAVGAGIALTNLATDGIGKIVGVLGDSEKAYQDAAVSTAQFNTALKNNIPGINDQKQALGDTSDAMQSVMEDNLKYGFSMDDQRSTMALLVGVTKDGDQALSDSAEAMDLARLKGIDLASATSIVMKAQEGNTGALKKLGIIVAPVTTAMDKLTATNKKATDAQKAALASANQYASMVEQSRLLMSLQVAAPPVSWGLIAILIFWTAALFFGVGLYAQSNAVVLSSLAFGAISVAFAVFLILGLGEPYTGHFRVNPAALTEAIEFLGK